METEQTEKGFSVVSYIIRPEGATVYCHWAEGLNMKISKDGVTMKLNGKEIQQIVRSLPLTIGSSY